MSSKPGSVKRIELVARLKRLGFEGPFAGGKHQFLVRGTVRLTLPNPHRTEIGLGLLKRILDQAGISREDWEGTD